MGCAPLLDEEYTKLSSTGDWQPPFIDDKLFHKIPKLVSEIV